MSKGARRKELKALGLQDTQRGWDNYVGDKPIKSRDRKGFYDNARAALESRTELPSSLPPPEPSPEEGPKTTFTPRRRKRSSALQNAMDEMGLT